MLADEDVAAGIDAAPGFGREHCRQSDCGSREARGKLNRWRGAPRRPRTPPPAEKVAELLADYCRAAGITRLEAFGSTARGEARRGSDVDLLATFSRNPGLRFFTMAEEMAGILGVPVHLLTHESVEQMSNPYRRASILADARLIYHA